MASRGGMTMSGAACHWAKAWIAVAVLLAVGGCTSPSEYIRNGFKVGTNKTTPVGTTATHWIDEADERVKSDCADVDRWWTVFRDPKLNELIVQASNQSLTLREAGYRVLAARAKLGYQAGNIFPQTQQAFGAYSRNAASQLTNNQIPGSQFYDQWNMGFNLSWEMDLWGRLRRAITAAENTLEASVAKYDDVLVTLLGDVATNYVQVRTLQERIELVRSNVELQTRMLNIADRRYRAGRKNALDSDQARSNLAQTEAQIPQLQIELRKTQDSLCILLGTPPRDLDAELGRGPIPTASTSVTVGIPAELLRRRPDVRRAEHEAAAQGEQIGIATAALYPMFSINGNIGYQASDSEDLIHPKAFTGSVGPQFKWDILNYGRILNNMREQEANFWALAMVYQQTVLKANAEVEDGLVTFLKAQERAKLLDISVFNAKKAVDIVFKEYRVGTIDFNRVALIEQDLVQQQDQQAQSHGDIAKGLIQVYRALGGGWEVRPAEVVPLPPVQTPDEAIPSPAPEPGSTQQFRRLPMPEDIPHVSNNVPLPPASNQ